ncbi:GNAT family N-acetyltransferase [Bacillus sp. T33-2]|uniref:GNAT family N-acetyltransferase n=1 Tax=Bacillus sp. T33-2 TaxID=2054168 RepID=UPI000C772E98|nr:GNAT family N-acetyltransferase [Bacillus sp. T33-2]PLR95054.1 GNAT family N-acetyltransferase [Bacillus sp. T33-2]
MTIKITELKSETELREAFPVMRQLRTHLNEQSYLELVKEATEKEGYKMAALYEQGKIVAVTGFMPMITLYHGSYIWVCDLVTVAGARSKGYGAALLTYVQNWAKDNGYTLVSLSSGLQRVDAHRFYEDKMHYEKTSFVYKKVLN